MLQTRKLCQLSNTLLYPLANFVTMDTTRYFVNMMSSSSIKTTTKLNGREIGTSQPSFGNFRSLQPTHCKTTRYILQNTIIVLQHLLHSVTEKFISLQNYSPIMRLPSPSFKSTLNSCTSPLEIQLWKHGWKPSTTTTTHHGQTFRHRMCINIYANRKQQR